MLKITLRETYDEPNPPSRSFAVMEARASLREVAVDVSATEAYCGDVVRPLKQHLAGYAGEGAGL